MVVAKNIHHVKFQRNQFEKSINQKSKYISITFQMYFSKLWKIFVQIILGDKIWEGSVLEALLLTGCFP